jgi:hypothetical protein
VGGKPKMAGTDKPRFTSASASEVNYHYAADKNKGIRIILSNATAHFHEYVAKNNKQMQINSVELGMETPAANRSTTICYCIRAITSKPSVCGF